MLTYDMNPFGVYYAAYRATIVYGKIHMRRLVLSDHKARFIALKVASYGERDKLSDSLLVKLVSANADESWELLCIEYAYNYLKYVENVNPDALERSEQRALLEKLTHKIDSAVNDLKFGTRAEDDIMDALEYPGALDKALANFPSFFSVRQFFKRQFL